MITACYMVHNEGEFLRQSLESVAPYVEKILLADMGSKDETHEICRSFPRVEVINMAHLSVRHFEGEMRQELARRVKTPWMLIMDGDEILADMWRQAVDPWLANENLGALESPVVNLVGSYEYVWLGLDDFKSQRLMRWHSALRYSPAPGFEASGTHGGFPRREGSLRLPGGPVIWHYGWTKRDLKAKLQRNIRRGDQGTHPDVMERELADLETKGVWSRMPPLRRGAFTAEQTPQSMRSAFDTTYRLTVEYNHITRRQRIETREDV